MCLLPPAPRLIIPSKVQVPEGQVVAYTWGEVASDCIGERAVKQWYERLLKEADAAQPQEQQEGSDGCILVDSE